MPKVGGRHLSYSGKGKRAAKTYAKKTGKKVRYSGSGKVKKVRYSGGGRVKKKKK